VLCFRGIVWIQDSIKRLRNYDKLNPIKSSQDGSIYEWERGDEILKLAEYLYYKYSTGSPRHRPSLRTQNDGIQSHPLSSIAERPRVTRGGGGFTNRAGVEARDQRRWMRTSKASWSLWHRRESQRVALLTIALSFSTTATSVS
jgi:hypothetical protein